jgi:hypothetical protein
MGQARSSFPFFSIHNNHDAATMQLFLHLEPSLAEADEDELREGLQYCFLSAAAADCAWLLHWHAQHSRLALHDLPWTEVVRRTALLWTASSSLFVTNIVAEDDACPASSQHRTTRQRATPAGPAAAADGRFVAAQINVVIPWPVIMMCFCISTWLLLQLVAAVRRGRMLRRHTSSRSLRARAATANAQQVGVMRVLDRVCSLVTDAAEFMWRRRMSPRRCWARFVAALRACTPGIVRAARAVAGASQRSWQNAVVTRRTAALVAGGRRR